MNATPTTAAFDVQREPGKVLPTEYRLNNLQSAPRLPVDLALVMIEVRKALNWTTRSFNTKLLEGISEKSLNPVEGVLTAEEGTMRAFVNAAGSQARVFVFPELHTDVPVQGEMRDIFTTSQPFMPSMTDPLWTPPGLDDPFMKADPNADVSRERGWPTNYAMPWSYGRFGQAVNGDLHDCRNLPDGPEDLFLRFIDAAKQIRVSIMGVMSSSLPTGGYASLAISESDMELKFFRPQRLAYATFFTCGNSNPRPAIDVLHRSFAAGVTQVDAYARGRDVQFSYEGAIVRGGTGRTVWKDSPVHTDNQLLFGNDA
jgi:S-adenosylmethionine/arginine decarboxylase-like enzyme